MSDELLHTLHSISAEGCAESPAVVDCDRELTYGKLEEQANRPAHLLRDHDSAMRAPLHFVLSIFDLFAAASAGSAVVLHPASLSVFPVRLAGFIHDTASQSGIPCPRC